MFMFDDGMQNGYMWNDNAFGENFFSRRIQESYPFDMMGNENDTAYLWEMYPKESKIIKRLVEETLDMEDYRGSFIYDEYPDKYLFFRMTGKIVDRYMNEYADKTKDDGKSENKNPWITEVVQVILANEIFRRRNRKRFW